MNKLTKNSIERAADRYAALSPDDLSGFDYLYEDAVTIRDTGRRAVRIVPIEVDGQRTLALYSTSRKALEEVVSRMTAGAPVVARAIRRPTREEIARFLAEQAPRLLPGVASDDDDASES